MTALHKKVIYITLKYLIEERHFKYLTRINNDYSDDFILYEKKVNTDGIDADYFYDEFIEEDLGHWTTVDDIYIFSYVLELFGTTRLFEIGDTIDLVKHLEELKGGL